MKILHIGLTEHGTLHELMDNFFSAQPEGSKFVPTKKEAENRLIREGNSTRVFYSKRHILNKLTTFELMEAIID